MKLESSTITIKKSAETIFNFLADIKNFESLMPENTSKFEVLGDDKFLFALKGMPEIVLKKKEAIRYSKLTLGAAGGKLDFALTAFISEIGIEESEVKLDFSGEFNAMMAMMIKGPITKFIDTLTKNMAVTI